MFLFSASHTISRFLYFLYFEGTCDEHLLAMCAFDGKRSEEEVYLVDWWSLFNTVKLRITTETHDKRNLI